MTPVGQSSAKTRAKASPQKAANGLLGRAGLIIASGACALAMLGSSPAPAPGTFIWNYTPSVPVGLYRIVSSDWSRGDYVAVKPSAPLASILAEAGVIEPDRFLLKRVVAGAGDIVCREGLSVSVNGAKAATARAADTTGTMLPAWSGCRALSSEDIFLLGEEAASFDGRYFGPTAASDIVGSLQPMLVFTR